jgi:phosphoglycerol transferase MdoB-like AlkP superfamily enzyme
MKNKSIHSIIKLPYFKLFCNFALALLLMSISRLLFYFLNQQLFESTTKELFIALVYGIRFDISALVYINILYLTLYFLPIINKNNKYFQKGLKIIFITTNSVALIANLIDIIYYRFTIKRTTADVFDYLAVGGDFDKLIPTFLKDFWYIAIIFALFVIVFIKLYQTPIFNNNSTENIFIKTAKQLIVFIIVIGMSIVGMRGGLQLRPINILSASLKTGNNLSAVVLNSPFTIMQTLGKAELNTLDYFDESNLSKIYSPIHLKTEVNLLPDSISRRKNIVIIIVESLSQEHLHYYNNQTKIDTLAPFLERLCQKSLCFDGYANGKKSIEGIPALLSGIPTLMNKAFISSAYSNNQHHSLANSLKEMGYQSQFFHGGTNGTMGFDSYTKNAGFDQYFGRKEYNNESHYDGKWGIWDEHFLQFCAKKITKLQAKPLLSVIFTLSSHHPYSIPEAYEDKFTKGDLPIHRTIKYADYALEQFFKKIEKEKWYRNTLFVITSDHTSETNSKFYGNTNGIFKIPFIFFDPNYDLSTYSKNIIFQQIDLLPSILAYKNYNKPFVSFGNNKLDTNTIDFAVQFKHPNYQLIKDKHLMTWNSDGIQNIYNLEDDNILEKDLSLNFEKKEELEQFLKAFIQQYNNRLILNKQHINNQP